MEPTVNKEHFEIFPALESINCKEFMTDILHFLLEPSLGIP